MISQFDQEKSATDYPLVTVAIPTYNSADKVVETIDSVLNQSYPNIELILQDDNSQDETVQKLRTYVKQDSEIVLNINAYNLGAWKNFAATLQIAHGNYVHWLCPGDFMLPNFIETCVKTMVNVPGTVAVMTGTKVIHEATRKKIETLSFHEISKYQNHRRLELASSILRKTRPLETGRPHFGLFIHGLLQTDVIRNAIKSFDGSGPILNERMVLSQLAFAGSFAGLEDILYVKEAHLLPSPTRKPHDPGVQAKLKPFLLTRWTAKMVWATTRSQVVPLRYKICLPAMISRYLVYNLGHSGLIWMVPILKNNMPGSRYLWLRRLWRRKTNL